MSWKTFFLVLSLYYSIISAQENTNIREFFPPTSLTNTDGLANTIVNNCVSVISGDFIEQGVGLALDGPTPLLIGHGYCSANRSNRSLSYGWNFMHPHDLYIEQTEKDNEKEYYIAYCGEDSGGMHEHYGKKILKDKNVQEVSFGKGYQIGAVSFSAKEDLRNIILTWNTKNKNCKVLSGSGEHRNFEKVGGKKLQHFVLSSSIKPNRTCFEYTYGKHHPSRVREITALNAPNGIPYGHINFDYYSHPSTVTATSHDFRYVHYEMKGYSVDDMSSRKTIKHYLTRISGSDCPLRMYTYHHNDDNTEMLLNSRVSLTGNFIQPEYYKAGENSLSKLGVVYTDYKKKDHFRDSVVDKVKKLKEPVGTTNRPITTYRFVYSWINKITERTKNGFTAHQTKSSTDVYNAHLNKTTYCYDGGDKIKKIEFYRGIFPNYALDHSEEYLWDCYSNKLVSKTDLDSEGKVVNARSFNYDARGNIISEALEGDLSGNGIVQAYTRWFKYSDDGFNNLIAEGDDEGAIIEYEYLPGTNILIARFVTGSNGIELREFRHYDAQGFCFCETHDNGKSKDFNDLSNVTERVSTLREYHVAIPLFGKVSSEKVVYWDPSLGILKRLKSTSFTYNETGRLIRREAYDAGENFCYAIEYGYDSKGRIVWETDPYGNVLEKSYDEEGNLLFEKGPDANVEKHYTYDFAHRKIKEEERHSDGTVISIRHKYNHLNQKTSSIDHLEQKTTYEYDDFGRLIQTKYPAVNLLGESVSPVTINEYDTLGNVIRTLDKEGIWSTSKYTVRGDISEKIYPDGSSEKRQYTLSGKLKEVIRPDGTMQRYSYDKMGNVLAEGLYDISGELLSETKYAWRSKRKIAQYNPSGPSILYSYDGLGRCVEEAKGNHRTVYAYSSRGYLNEEKQYEGQQLLQIKQREHDYFGRIIEEKHLDGEGKLQMHQTFVYDSAGRKIVESVNNDDGKILSTFTTFDSRNRITKVTDPEGAETHYTYTSDFDPFSGGWIDALEVTDSSGRITRERKDAAQRVVLVEVYDQFGQLLQKKTCSYNLYGKCIETTDSLIYNDEEVNTQIRRSYYDILGRLVAETSHAGTPQQTITRHTYDSMGRKTKVLRNDGTELYWIFDAQGRVKNEYDSKLTFDHHYEYDSADHPTKIWDPIQDWQIERLYNAQDQLEQEKFSPELFIKYSYDALDRPNLMTFHDGTSVKYTYKGFNHESTIRLNTQQEEVYQHKVLSTDLAGRILSLQLAGKAGEISFAYDNKGRTTNIDSEHLKGQFKYALDDTLIESHYQDTLGDFQKKYSYDSLSQLTQESHSHSYKYDNLGNRRSINGMPYVICANTNRLLESNGNHYKYDENGNLTSVGNMSFEYDSLDRLRTVRKGNEMWKYTYDALHRRIAKEHLSINPDQSFTSLSKEKYLYVGVTEAGSVDENHHFTSLRIFGYGKQAKEGQAAAIELGGKAYAPIYDHQGSLRSLIDSETGESSACYRYDAFGCIENSEGPVAEMCPWRYLGKRLDNETGFTFFGRRFYMPEVGRWLTLDPSGYSTGANGYLYVKNNPLTLFDLYGLQEFNPFSCAMNFIGELFYCFIATIPRFGFISKGLAYIPFLMMGFRSEDFGSYYGDERSSSYTVGEDISPGGFCVSNICGILNNLHSCTEMAFAVKNCYGTEGVYSIHNSSHGFFWDIMECIIQKCGIKTHSVQIAAEQLRVECKLHDRVIVNAHSQGALILSCALDYLTPEEVSKLQIRTFGGAKMILNDNAYSCINIVGKGDLVPLFSDPIGLLKGILSGNHKIEYCNSGFGEHSFDKETYSKALFRHGTFDKIRNLKH
ncbi:MAG: RHS repeat-associated core domain-containing protein [Parachlamydiales bacterium]|jgi:RHS repeat-associated protein